MPNPDPYRNATEARRDLADRHHYSGDPDRGGTAMLAKVMPLIDDLERQLRDAVAALIQAGYAHAEMLKQQADHHCPTYTVRLEDALRTLYLATRSDGIATLGHPGQDGIPTILTLAKAREVARQALPSLESTAGGQAEDNQCWCGEDGGPRPTPHPPHGRPRVPRPPGANTPSPSAKVQKHYSRAPPADQPLFPLSRRRTPVSLKGSTKFDAIRREAYLQLLREGKRKYRAARDVGVHPRTVSLYREKHPSFEIEESVAQVEAVEVVEDALFQTASTPGAPGHVDAAKFFLQNQAAAEWNVRKDARVELTGANGGPIGVESSSTFVRDVLASPRASAMALALLDEIAEADPEARSTADSPTSSPEAAGFRQ